MEWFYIHKLSIIFFIGLLTFSWCCVFWIGNRKRQISTFIFVYTITMFILTLQFPSDFIASENHDQIGFVLAVALDYLPHGIPNTILYAFSAIFILWFIYDICWQKFKLKHSVQQIFASWRVHQPFFPIKKS